MHKLVPSGGRAADEGCTFISGECAVFFRDFPPSWLYVIAATRNGVCPLGGEVDTLQLAVCKATI